MVSGVKDQVEPRVGPALWAASGRGGGRLLIDARLGRPGDFPVPAGFAGQQAVVAHPAEPLGHEVSGEAVEEFASGECHGVLASAIPVIRPHEAYRAGLFIHRGEPLVADGYPAGVSREVPHHRPRVAQRRPAENVPVPARQFQPPVPAALDGGQCGRPEHFGMGIQLLQHAQEDGAVHPRHVPDRKQVVAPGLLPSSGFEIFAPGANEHVQMRMPMQRAAPGVLDGQKPAGHLPVVLLEGLERFGTGGKKQIGRNPVIRLEEGV